MLSARNQQMHSTYNNVRQFCQLYQHTWLQHSTTTLENQLWTSLIPVRGQTKPVCFLRLMREIVPRRVWKLARDSPSPPLPPLPHLLPPLLPRSLSSSFLPFLPSPHPIPPYSWGWSRLWGGSHGPRSLHKPDCLTVQRHGICTLHGQRMMKQIHHILVNTPLPQSYMLQGYF